MQYITSDNLFTLLQYSNVNIIDIRPFYKFKNKHLPNSINIDEKKLIKYPNKYISKNITYYIICEKGISSKYVSTILNKKGYNTISVIGGFSSLNFI